MLDRKRVILEEVFPEERVTGEPYICSMKHGWIEGMWDESDGTCGQYYWRDMEWYPHTTYRIVEEK